MCGLLARMLSVIALPMALFAGVAVPAVAAQEPPQQDSEGLPVDMEPFDELAAMEAEDEDDDAALLEELASLGVLDLEDGGGDDAARAFAEPGNMESFEALAEMDAVDPGAADATDAEHVASCRTKYRAAREKYRQKLRQVRVQLVSEIAAEMAACEAFTSSRGDLLGFPSPVDQCRDEYRMVRDNYLSHYRAIADGYRDDYRKLRAECAPACRGGVLACREARRGARRACRAAARQARRVASRAVRQVHRLCQAAARDDAVAAMCRKSYNRSACRKAARAAHTAYRKATRATAQSCRKAIRDTRRACRQPS